MSNKSYNRGTEVIRRDTDRKVFSKREEILAGRMLDKMNADMQRLEEENAALKTELQRAKSAYQRRCAEVDVLKEEIKTVTSSEESTHALYMSCVQALTNSRKGHEKLTAVMKTALTPEQYHDARTRAADAYPELFKNEN